MPSEARDEAEQRLLKATQETFPNWDFHKIFGGWEAVPRETPVIRGVDLHSIIEKLTDYTEKR
jgi:hypothetical protein